MPSELENTAAPGVPFFTPAQTPPAGSPKDAPSAPTLFTPLKVRGVETHNRFVVSPMCTYSAKDGHLTDWHLVHYGQFALHGAGLVIVEATGVEARGRISPNDSGLWADSQIAPLRRVVDFVHSQGTKAGIQLAHAGRKASTLPPWIGGTIKKTVAPKDVGGWADDVVSSSDVPYDGHHAKPHELSVDEIKQMTQSFVDAAKRAVEAGFDVIEIHGAHGYLNTNFLSPLSNKRTDQYGGSFENRTRFLTETLQAVRAAIPETMPLWLRISATEWAEHLAEPSWDIDQTIRLAKLLPGLGVDVIDVSTGGNTPEQKIKVSQTFQTDLAKSIREAVRAESLPLLVGAVGFVTSGEFARGLVQEDADPSADYALAARQFLRDPQFVLSAAHEVGVDVNWAKQYQRAPPKPRGRRGESVFGPAKI